MSDTDRRRLDEIGRWVVTTCLTFGTDPGLAYKVAGTFVAGLQENWERAATRQMER